MKRRLFALILSFAMVLSMLTPTQIVFASTVSGAWQGPETALANEEVTLTFSVNADFNIFGFSGKLVYDSTQISSVSVASAIEDNAGWDFTYDSGTHMMVANFNDADDAGISGDSQALFTVTFTVAEDLAVGTVVNVSLEDAKLTEGYDQLNAKTHTIETLSKSIRVVEYVAKIGDVKYISLADAVAAAQNGDTVVVIKDFTINDNLGAEIPAGKSITLDLNGFTVSQIAPDAKASALIRNKGTLVVKDSSEEGTGKLTAKAVTPDSSYGYGNYVIENSGIFTLESGTVEQTSAGAGAYYAINSAAGATVNMQGGAAVSSGIAIRVATFGTGKATFNMTGGEVIADGYAFQFYGLSGSGNHAEINISGGSLETTAEDGYSFVALQYSGSFDDVKVNISGGSFDDGWIYFPAVLPLENIAITGGVFDGDVYDPTEEEGAFISGGYFKEGDPAVVWWPWFALPDMKPVLVESGEYAGYYTLVDRDYVAAIGDVKYESLAEAVAAAENGDSIVMLADVTIDGNQGVTIPAGKEVTLDLNGKTVTLNLTESKASALIDNRGTLTIKDSSEEGTGKLTNTANGTVTGDWPTYNYATNIITNSGNLTVESGTIENTCDSGICYAIDNNSTAADAIVTVNGGSILSDGNSAIRQFCNSTTHKNEVTVNGGLLEATYYAISLQNSNSNPQYNGKLTVTGGELSATDDEYNCAIACWISSENFEIDITGGKFDDCVVIAEGTDAEITGGEFVYDSFTDPDDGTVYPLESFVSEGFIVAANDSTTYKYTVREGAYVAKIGDVRYESLAAAVAAAKAGETVEIIVAGTYKLPNIPLNITIKGAVEDVIIDATAGGTICSVPNGVTFEDLTFNFGQSYYHGFTHAGLINMNGCELNGLLFNYGDMNFTDCVFNQDKEEYVMWAYGANLTYDGCVFNVHGKTINVYNEGGAYSTVTAKDCVFNSDKVNKSALNVKETCGSTKLNYKVTIENCTTNGNFPTDKIGGSKLYMVDDQLPVGEASGLAIYVDGVLVYPLYVASIGDNVYFSLAEAVAAAENGDTIVMIADETVEGNAGITIPAGLTVTIDLNGHTVKNAVNENKASQVINNKGNLTIKDSSEDGTGGLTNAVAEGTAPGEWWGTNPSNYATNVITNTGILTVEGGTIEQTAGGSICYAIDNNSSGADAILNMKGGTVKSGKTAVRMFANSTTKENTLNMTGGTIQGGYAAIWVQLPGSSGQAKKATVNISGGALKATNTGESYAFYDYSFGDVFDNVAYNVTGGVFDSINGIYSYGVEDFIHGGYFSDISDMNADAYVPEDYKFVEVTEGTYAGYYTIAARDYVAAIGDVKYESLAEAIAAAKDGDTVELLADCTVTNDHTGHENNGAIYIYNDITIDGNDHTITADFSKKSHVFAVENGKVTFKDVTIDGDGAAKHGVNVNHGCEAIFDSVVIENCLAYSIVANGGAVTVKGTSDITDGGWGAINVDSTAAGKNGTLTVAGGTIGTINIESNKGTDNSATLTGGTIDKVAAIGANTQFTVDGASVTATDAVAKIGNTYYGDLNDALAAATNGQTVTLLKDAAISALTVPTGVTLDLNGKAVTPAVAAPAVVNNGTIVLYDVNEPVAAFLLFNAPGTYKAGEALDYSGVYGFAKDAIVVSEVVGPVNGQFQRITVTGDAVWNAGLNPKTELIVNGNLSFSGNIMPSTEDAVEAGHNASLLSVSGDLTLTGAVTIGKEFEASADISAPAGQAQVVVGGDLIADGNAITLTSYGSLTVNEKRTDLVAEEDYAIVEIANTDGTFTYTTELYPDKITSEVYEVDQDKLIIRKVALETTKLNISLNNLNEKKNVALNDGEGDYVLSDAAPTNRFIGTGDVAKLMKGNEVIKTYTYIVTGDINGDGEADITDLTIIREYILGKTTLDELEMIAANVNNDDEVNITDLVIIQAYILGKTSILPY